MGSVKQRNRPWGLGAIMGLFVAVAACAVDPPVEPDEGTSISEICACPAITLQVATGEEVSPLCVADCGICGDGFCALNEEDTCSADCGPTGPVCGNGSCESGETSSSCPSDCGTTGPVCGNGRCETGELTSCPSDCCGISPAITNLKICPAV